MLFLQYSACLRELQEIMRQEAGLPIDNEPTDTSLTDHEASTSGSNSSQTDGPPTHLQAFNKVVTVVVRTNSSVIVSSTKSLVLYLV